MFLPARPRGAGQGIAVDISRKRASLVTFAMAAAAAACAAPLPTIPDPVAQDLIITAAIKTALLNDRAVTGVGIDVETVAGVVTLSGVVPTEAGERRAIEVARAADGVVDVRSQLRIERSRSPVEIEPGMSAKSSACRVQNRARYSIAAIARSISCAAPSFSPSAPEDALH